MDPRAHSCVTLSSAQVATNLTAELNGAREALANQDVLYQELVVVTARKEFELEKEASDLRKSCAELSRRASEQGLKIEFQQSTIAKLQGADDQGDKVLEVQRLKGEKEQLQTAAERVEEELKAKTASLQQLQAEMDELRREKQLSLAEATAQGRDLEQLQAELDLLRQDTGTRDEEIATMEATLAMGQVCCG